MTDLALPPMQVGGCREVSAREISDVRAVLASDALVACPVAERVETHGAGGGPEGRLFTRGGPQESLFHVAGTVQPLRCGAEDVTAFAELLAGHGIGPMSVHGRRELVAMLWPELRERWGVDGRVRDTQQLMALLESCTAGTEADAVVAAGGEPVPEAAVRAARGVRPARVEDFELVVPAAAAVYRDELDSDPMAVARGRPFRRRVARGVARGRSMILLRDGRVVFKADIAARSSRVAQLQGVWVEPELRGRGLGTACMAVVCRRLQDRGLVPSLVVNGFNERAMRTYTRLGMRPVVDYCTVLVG